MSRELIDSYAAGAEMLSMAVRGLAQEDFKWKPSAESKAGRWSIQQLVAHLADFEGVQADRMKRVIADESPQLLAFDESRWAAALAYDQRKVDDSLSLIHGIRGQMVAILHNAPAWQRSGMHSERGPLTLSQLVTGAIEHLDHHLEFVHAKRRAMGKEMW